MSISKFVADEPKQSSNPNSREIAAPAALRNREAIADSISGILPDRGNVLELASGTGEHICHFAERFGHLTWQPSEMDSSRLDSISAYVAKKSLQNLSLPHYLDVADTNWHALEADVIIAINLLHVAPKAVSTAVLKGAAQVLRPNGKLILYGPFTVNRQFNTDSNRQFDEYLRQQNPAWGLRDLADLDALAKTVGMERVTLLDMPANNYLVHYQMPGVVL